MKRADWEAATPKCPRGEVSNLPAAICGEPLRWDDKYQRWVCLAHGSQFTGREAGRRGGYAGMWFEDAA